MSPSVGLDSGDLEALTAAGVESVVDGLDPVVRRRRPR
jgi:hypothetical protein